MIPPKDLFDYFNRPFGFRIMEEVRYEQAQRLDDNEQLTVHNVFPYEQRKGYGCGKVIKS